MALNRRQFLKSAVVGAGGVMLNPGRCCTTAEREAESSLARAIEGIERNRQDELVLRVIGADHHPLPGIAVEIHQLSHSFLWGGNLFGWTVPGAPEIEAAYRTRFANLFNFATLDFYWHQYEPEQGRPRYARTDAAVDWCQANDIACKGHPLVWASIPDPTWLPKDAAAIREASLGRVREIVGRFRGKIDVWDVVNEPSLLLWANTRLGDWAQSVGTHSFVSQHLRAAREANPAGTLLLNEVLTAYPSYSLLDGLREEGKPLFNAVGLQSHMHRGPWPLDGMWTLCDRYGGLGVPLHFTEFTVLSAAGTEGRWEAPTAESEQAQADHAARHYTLLFGHPAVAAVSWWDLSDRAAWKAAPAGLLRADMSPKPAYEQLHELIRKQWWTTAQGQTNSDGQFMCRAFHGRHRVTVCWPDGREAHRDIDCARGPKNVIEMIDSGS